MNSMSYFDDTGNFTWSDSTATTGNFTLIGCTNTSTFIYRKVRQPVIPDKNWMPYDYVEYEPKWHKKYARYKLQMKKMWN